MYGAEQEKTTIKSLMNDLGANFIYDLSETWLVKRLIADLINANKKTVLFFAMIGWVQMGEVYC